MSERTPLVRHRDEVPLTGCPHGDVTRIVTGGEGGVANVHVVRVTKGGSHHHLAYDEVYYVLLGHGALVIGDDEHELRPGSVAVIPRGVQHSLEADPGDTLEFIIFGTPAVPIDDERAQPRK